MAKSKAGQIRDWMNKNSAMITIFAVLLLIAALAAIVMQARGPGVGGPVDVYYYDLQSGELFTSQNTKNPPIPSPTGNGLMPDGTGAGVQAVVFACGDCSSGERFAGYVLKYSQRLKEALDDPQAQQELEAKLAEQNLSLTEIQIAESFIATPEEAAKGEWRQFTPELEDEYRQAAQAKCQGKRLVTCQP